MTQATILLIDDDKNLLELFSSHLEAVGYRPLTARDGATGLRLATESRPDLVGLDVMMPGMDGWEVCERLREKSSIPLIMITAKSDRNYQTPGVCLRAGDTRN